MCIRVFVVRKYLKVVADDLMRVQLNTMDEERVVAFETDPCAMEERYAPVEYNGAQYYRYTAGAQGQFISVFQRCAHGLYVHREACRAGR